MKKPQSNHSTTRDHTHIGQRVSRSHGIHHGRSTRTCVSESISTIRYDTNFIELLDMERRYNAKQKDWESFCDWKTNRNPERAVLEAKFGYDTKHALHLVRLLRMCREILTEGLVRVRRPDFEELLAIRAGAWTYEQLVEWAVNEDKAMGELMLLSKLPSQANRKKIDALCKAIIEESFGVLTLKSHDRP